MNLRGFAIYAEEAIVERYQGGFYMRFHRESCVVAELYSALAYRKVHTPSVRKVLVQFVPVDEFDDKDSRFLPGPGVARVRRPFAFDKYVASGSAHDKKLMLLEGLHEALMWIAERLKWPKLPFLELRQAALDAGLVFQGYGSRSWPSPNRRFRVRTYFVFDIDGVQLYAVLFFNRRTRELARIHLGWAPAETGCLRDYLRVGRWRLKGVFELHSTSFIQQKWKADFREVIAANS